MTRPLRIQYPNAFYHVTCRGNEQREIFRDKEDREVFLGLLARSLDIFEEREESNLYEHVPPLVDSYYWLSQEI